MADRDEYADRAANPNLDNPARVAARNCWRYAATITTVEDMEKVIAEAYAQKLAYMEAEVAKWESLGNIEDRLERGACAKFRAELARVTEERDQWKAQSKRHEKALDEAYKELEGVPELIAVRDRLREELKDAVAAKDATQAMYMRLLKANP